MFSSGRRSRNEVQTLWNVVAFSRASRWSLRWPTPVWFPSSFCEQPRNVALVSPYILRIQSKESDRNGFETLNKWGKDKLSPSQTFRMCVPQKRSPRHAASSRGCCDAGHKRTPFNSVWWAGFVEDMFLLSSSTFRFATVEEAVMLSYLFLSSEWTDVLWVWLWQNSERRRICGTRRLTH